MDLSTTEPTGQFRFVRRRDGFGHERLVLQQAWMPPPASECDMSHRFLQWLDVPICDEETGERIR